MKILHACSERCSGSATNRCTIAANRIDQCRSKIQEAECDLGPLSFGQKSDLLLDNFEWIPGSAESHEIVQYLERA